MESLEDFRSRFLTNLPKCKGCGTETKSILEGLIRAQEPPYFPSKYFIIFQCPECSKTTTALFFIKKISLKTSDLG
jgi:ribosomal protein S27E